MPSINYPVIGAEQNLPYYVCGIGIEFNQDNIYRHKGFSYPQFIIFTQGEGELILQDKNIPLHSKCALFLPADVPHEYCVIEGNWQSWWINFTGRDIDKLLDTLGFTEPMIISSAASNEKLFKILRNAYQAMSSDALYGNFYASGLLYEFILEMYKHARNTPYVHSKAPNRLLKAVEYIDNHYAEKITMEQLCRAADLSEAHLCRLFKKHFEMRPMEYLNKKRIQRSKELLSLSYISVEKAAAAVGFDTPSYYGRLFRRYEGCSPSEYKSCYFSQGG